MELRELKYFLAVAQTGSISAAADSLYITQPRKAAFGKTHGKT